MEQNDTSAVETFTQSITMAELALFETATGSTLGDAETGTTIAGMAVIAAHRLGHTLSLADAETLSMADANTIMEAAAAAATVKPDAVQDLLNSIAGK